MSHLACYWTGQPYAFAAETAHACSNAVLLQSDNAAPQHGLLLSGTEGYLCQFCGVVDLSNHSRECDACIKTKAATVIEQL